MINRLRVSNFRSLGQDVDLELGPLTVLVGQNGSGKSNVVDALRFLSDAMYPGLEAAVTKRHGIAAVRRWSSGRPFNLTISVDASLEEDVQATYSFTLKGDTTAEYSVKSENAQISHPLRALPTVYKIEDGNWIKRPPDLRPRVDSLNLALPLLAADERFRALADELRNIAVYSIFPDVLREPQKYDPTKPMNEHGGNWVSILKDPVPWKDDLVAALGKLTGDIEDLKVRSTGGYLLATFKHSANGKTKKKWFDAAQESDGTLRVAGILTALLQDPSLPLIAIEEPELTVHPGALELLCDYIRQASKSSQVVVTTHSPELLDQLTADEVRVVERRDGVTSVAPLDEEQRELVRDRLMTLGEVLRTEGLKQESGHVSA